MLTEKIKLSKKQIKSISKAKPKMSNKLATYFIKSGLNNITYCNGEIYGFLNIKDIDQEIFLKLKEWIEYDK